MMATVAEAVEQYRAECGTPSARKSGRNPEWPYVPIIVLRDGSTPNVIGHGSTSQILGLAYATRAEAVARAERHIDALVRDFEQKISEPRYRALREQYGLPRELVS